MRFKMIFVAKYGLIYKARIDSLMNKIDDFNQRFVFVL